MKIGCLAVRSYTSLLLLFRCMDFPEVLHGASCNLSVAVDELESMSTIILRLPARIVGETVESLGELLDLLSYPVCLRLQRS